jgi:hypothetical protein
MSDELLYMTSNFCFIGKHIIREYIDDNTCKVCRDKEATYLMLPCSHLSYCLDCVSVLEKCVICRKQHHSILNVFKS